MKRCRTLAINALLGLFLHASMTVRADDAMPLPDSGGVSADFAEQVLNDREHHSYSQLQQLAQALDRASREVPDNKRLSLLAARAQLTILGPMGQYRANQLIERVLQEEPRQPEALVLKAASESMANCAPCAAATLAEARRSSPRHPEVLEATAHYYLREGWRIRSIPNAKRPEDKGQDYYAQAIDYFQRALAEQRSPSRRAGILVNIFDIQNFQGRYGQADLSIRKAIQTNPASANLHERYASFLIYRKGDWANGALQAREALLLRGSNQAKLTEAVALYMLWARSYEDSRKSPAKQEETTKLQEAARLAWPDADEIFLYATSAESTAPIAQVMLRAGLYSSARGDYRDKDGDTPLGNAILNYGNSRNQEGDGVDEKLKTQPAMLQLIDQLLADGANVNAFTSQGDTLLGAAARSGDATLFRKLLLAGANPHMPGRLGVTPLMAVASLENQEAANAMAAQLFERQVDVQLYDRPKRSALHYAAGSGNTGLVKELLKRGSKPEEKDEDGSTALDWAASGGQTRVAELLLAAGADINKHETACGSSDTADYAKSAGYEELAKLLRSRRKSAL